MGKKHCLSGGFCIPNGHRADTALRSFADTPHETVLPARRCHSVYITDCSQILAVGVAPISAAGI